MLPTKAADSKELMSIPHAKQIFADKVNVAHELERVKKNRMRMCGKTFTPDARRSESRAELGVRGRHTFSQICPGNEDEVLVNKEFLKLEITDQIEVVLAPLRAPIGVIEGCALHFGVIMGEVDDELIGTRGEVLQHLFVGIKPLRLGNARRDLQYLIENNGVGADKGRKIA